MNIPKRILSHLFLILALFITMSLVGCVKDVPVDKRMGRYGIVDRVVDGDTVVVNGIKVRLIGIDTPETVHPRKPVQCYGKEASSYLKDLLEGRRVRLEYGRERYGKYGRVLAYLYRGKTFVNAKMVEQGYAFAYKRFPFKYMDAFTRYEAMARKENRGLWGKCKIRCDDVKCESTGFN